MDSGHDGVDNTSAVARARRSDVRAGGGVRRSLANQKFGIPVGPRHAVVRQGLIAAIQDQPQLVIVRAPAGYGKTTLVAQWAAERRNAGDLVAWVTVNRFDDDVHAVWSLLIASIEAEAGSGADRISALIAPRTAIEPGFLEAFADAIAALNREVSLVIDDLHEVRNRAAVLSLEDLARNPPVSFRLVLVSRTQPDITVQRLGLAGRYDLFDAQSLQFGAGEAAELLRLHDIVLPNAELDAVLTRTEGWVAALRLAAVTIGSNPRPGQAIELLGDADVPIGSFLAEEVYGRHPPAIRAFLGETAICDYMSGDLARVLTGREDAAEVLHELQVDNTLIVRVDTEPVSYRYHPLLRDFLRSRLISRHPDRWRELQALASSWFEELGEPLQALAHAVTASDDERVERIMVASSFELIARGEAAAIRRLVGLMPNRMLHRPHCALTAAAAFLEVGDIATADTLLDGIEYSEEPDPHLAALEAVVRLHRARISGDVAEALRRSMSTIAGRSGNIHLDLDALLQQGVAMMYIGEYEPATEHLLAALDIATETQEDYVSVQCLSAMSMLSGNRSDLDGLELYARQALEIGRRHGWHMTPLCAFAYVGVGGAAFLRVDAARAESCARAAIDSLTHRSDPSLLAAAESLLAMVTFEASIDRLATVARLRETWERFGHEALTPGLTAYISPYELRMCLRVGRESWAEDVLNRCERRLGECGELWLLRAILATSRADTGDARGHVGRVLDSPASCLVQATLIEAWILEAELASALGLSANVEDAVGRALDVAGTQRLYRPFLAVSAPLRSTIRQYARSNGHRSVFAEQVIETTSDDPNDNAAITDREIELLRELETRHEVSVPATVEEAAAALFMSPNTAKSHLRSVYRKLGVNSREEALTKLRRRGLL